MATRHEITKEHARQYQAASKKEKSALLNGLTATTGWTRGHARRAIRAAPARKSAASQQVRRPRPRKHSCDVNKHSPNSISRCNTDRFVLSLGVLGRLRRG